MRSKKVAERYRISKQTAMGASDEAANQYDDCINLSLGDPDFTTPEPIIAQAFADARAGHTKYTDFRGDPQLREEIRKFYAEEYQIPLSDKEIFVTASGCLGMYLALEAILNDGDEVILQAPYFTPYPQQVTLARGVPVELPTYEAEDFQINITKLESLITPKTKALVLNSPSNPTGMCLSMDTLQRISEVVVKHDLLVIADDIYTAFSYEQPFRPLLGVDGMRERTIVINSFSKNFAMTGWRIGNLIAPKEIIEVVQEINENVVFTAPSISQRAAIFALQHRKELESEVREIFRERMFFAAEQIQETPNMSILYPPKGSIYLFINIKRTGLSSEEVCARILEQAHVLFLPGNCFGACGEGYIRMACTVSVDAIAEAFRRIKEMPLFQTLQD